MKYKELINHYREFIANLHGQGITAPKDILQTLFNNYADHIPQTAPFFSQDNTRADHTFVKQCIEQLNNVRTENELLRWIIETDKALSITGQFQHYDVHAEFHTLWISFFAYYPYLFNPRTVDLVLEANPENPALPTEEKRTQPPSLLKNSWMKARLLQQRSTGEELERVLAFCRVEARRVYGDTRENLAVVASVLESLTVDLSAKHRDLVFTTLLDITTSPGGVIYYIPLLRLSGLFIPLLSASQRQNAINQLIARRNSYTSALRMSAVLSLVSLESAPSAEHLEILFQYLNNLSPDHISMRNLDLRWTKSIRTLFLHFSPPQCDTVLKKLISLADDRYFEASTFANNVLNELIPYLPQSYDEQSVLFLTAPATGNNYGDLSKIVPRLSPNCRSLFLDMLIAKTKKGFNNREHFAGFLAEVGPSLAKFHPERVITALSELIKDEEVSIRIYAFSGLGQCATQLANPHTLSILDTLALTLERGDLPHAYFLYIEQLSGIIQHLESVHYVPDIALNILVRLFTQPQMVTGYRRDAASFIDRLSPDFSSEQVSLAFNALHDSSKEDHPPLRLVINRGMLKLYPRLSPEQREIALNNIWTYANKADPAEWEDIVSEVIKLIPYLELEILDITFTILCSKTTIGPGITAMAIAEVARHHPTQYLEKALKIVAHMTPSDDEIISRTKLLYAFGSLILLPPKAAFNIQLDTLVCLAKEFHTCYDDYFGEHFKTTMITLAKAVFNQWNSEDDLDLALNKVLSMTTDYFREVAYLIIKIEAQLSDERFAIAFNIFVSTTTQNDPDIRDSTLSVFARKLLPGILHRLSREQLSIAFDTLMGMTADGLVQKTVAKLLAVMTPKLTQNQKGILFNRFMEMATSYPLTLSTIARWAILSPRSDQVWLCTLLSEIAHSDTCTDIMKIQCISTIHQIQALEKIKTTAKNLLAGANLPGDIQKMIIDPTELPPTSNSDSSSGKGGPRS
jgi:hypothetical protein